MKFKQIKVKNTPLKVKLAETIPDQEKGLKFIDNLNQNEGMLFVYKQERVLSFWMKDTKIPLSIAFIDKNYKITQIEDLKPLSEDKIVSKKRSKFALEVNKGWFNKNNININDKISFVGHKTIKISVKK